MTTPPETLRRRLDGVLGRLLLAMAMGGMGLLFCGMAAVVVVRSVRDGNLIAVIALKLFALLMMGSIGLAFLYTALCALFPALSERAEQIPGQVRGLCAGCGHLKDDRCELCGELPAYTWFAARAKSREGLLLAPVMGGIGFLGVFLIAQGSSESPGLALISSLFGALMVLVGFGALWAFWADTSGKKPLPDGCPDYTLHQREQSGKGQLEARVWMKRGRIHRAEGSHFHLLPWAGLREREGALSPEEDALCGHLAAAWHQGMVSLSPRRERRWSLRGEPSRLAREESPETYRAGQPGQSPPEEVTVYLARAYISDEHTAIDYQPQDELLDELCACATLAGCLRAVQTRPELRSRLLDKAPALGLDRGAVDGMKQLIARAL